MKNPTAKGAAKLAALALSLGVAGCLIVKEQQRADRAASVQGTTPASGDEAPSDLAPAEAQTGPLLMGTKSAAVMDDGLLIGEEESAAPDRVLPRPVTLGTSKSLMIELPEAEHPDPSLLPTSKSLGPIDLERLMEGQGQASSPKKDR